MVKITSLLFIPDSFLFKIYFLVFLYLLTHIIIFFPQTVSITIIELKFSMLNIFNPLPKNFTSIFELIHTLSIVTIVSERTLIGIPISILQKPILKHVILKVPLKLWTTFPLVLPLSRKIPIHKITWVCIPRILITTLRKAM